MKKLEIRNIQEKDFEAVAGIIDITWNYREFGQSERLCKRKARKDLLGALTESNYAKVAVKDSQIVGFLIGTVNTQKINRDISLLKEYQKLKEENATTYDGRLFNNYADLFETANRKLREDFNGILGSEIIYFCTDPKYRGQGIGKYLIQDFLDTLNRNGAQHIFVHTDSTCNVEFYERLGFEKQSIIEGFAPLRNSKITFYLYTFHLE